MEKSTQVAHKCPNQNVDCKTMQEKKTHDVVMQYFHFKVLEEQSKEIQHVVVDICSRKPTILVYALVWYPAYFTPFSSVCL